MSLAIVVFNVVETIAFHAILTSHVTMDEESAVLFDRVTLNQGNGRVTCFMYRKGCFTYDSIMRAFTLLLLCLLLKDMTTQLEYTQCPLVEIDTVTSLFTVYDSTTEHSQCPLVEMDSITSLFIVYRYDNTTGTFTVPSGGDGDYYFSAFLTVFGGKFGYFDVEVNGKLICTISSNLTQTSEFETTSCNGVAYAVEGIHRDLKV